MGGRRGRRNRLLKDESSDEEMEEETEPDLEGYTQDIGRVVSVETGESKRGKEKWFPGLIVIPSAQPTVKINIKDEFLIRSFRDDRYYTVPKKEVSEFNKDLNEKIESTGLAEAIQKANKFLDNNELPLHWEKSSLFSAGGESDSDDNGSETSEEEQSEEKDRFVAQLYKYMDDSGTPLNKTPTVASKDIDLHRLFRVVHKMGGYNRVTNQNKWKAVAGKMRLPVVNQNTSNQIKSVYKKCLLSYEGFFRTLGVTMSNPIRTIKKDKGRSLIRDKDRTPISSPRPEIDDDSSLERKTPLPLEKIEGNGSGAGSSSSSSSKTSKRKSEPKEKESSAKKMKVQELKDELIDANRTKRVETKIVKEKKIKPGPSKEVKTEKVEEVKKDEKVQFTRSKSLTNIKGVMTTRQGKESGSPVAKNVNKPPNKKMPNKEEEEKKTSKVKKKLLPENALEPLQTANIGDKLIVYYGPTNESKVTYEAKVVDLDKDQTGPIYLVHYTGWNTRYDEWIPANRIAENLSSGTKSKRTKVPAPVNVKQPSSSSLGATSKPLKRNRLASASRTDDKPARSTTPSSVTSSSSLSKSPATPVIRSSRLAAKRGEDSKNRRVSAQTDVSIQSDSDTDSSESGQELPRTRSGSVKSEDVETKIRKRTSRNSKAVKRKETFVKEEDDDDEEANDDEIDKEEESESKGASEDEQEPLKGRDFDLNQIRSELKGFSKTLKIPAADTSASTSEIKPVIGIAEIKKEIKEEITIPAPHRSPPSPVQKIETTSEDVYEFKEPEPFEFESRSKLVDDKGALKKRPRIFDTLEDSCKSPRKTSLSPAKLDIEPRTYSRVPKKVQLSDEEDEVEDDDNSNMEKPMEDPFDKLIVSPSFNLIKTNPEKVIEVPITKAATDFVNEPPETSDEYSRDMELSDCESSQPQIYTREETCSFPTSFPKSPADRNTPDFSSGKTDEGKTTNSEDDDIQAQIQRVIAQSSSTDDDSDDLLVGTKETSSNSTPSDSVIIPKITSSHVSVTDSSKEPEIELQNPLVEDTKSPQSPQKPIDPALQETDSSLLESIVSKPPLILNPKLDDTGKELTVKTGTRIADSILQKFNFIKNNIGGTVEDNTAKVKIEEPPRSDDRPGESGKSRRKRPRAISKAIIDDSESDSSDSANLVIGSEDDADDDDSQASQECIKAKIINEPEVETIVEPQRNFNFDAEKKQEQEHVVLKQEEVKEEIHDPNLHSMLLCEEEIPGSPAQDVQNQNDPQPSSSSIHEMPFASAPGNSKMLMEPKKHQPPPLLMPLERDIRPDAQTTVIDNTPPTTPESTISNLSPRGDNGNASPNSDSKSIGEDYGRGCTLKVSPFSEEDTQADDLSRKQGQDAFGLPPLGFRKRRRSLRNSEDGSSSVFQPKRGRKPRQRRGGDSDSDDASESSMAGSGGGGTTPGSTTSLYERSARSPRPSKYNFFVEFDPSLDSSQRIAVLQQKLNELRKTYAQVKSELAAVERRRKKLKRRDRDAMKTSKQEVACA
ncbi:hypothetical protein ABEB36_006504 [Hypothenemus hampei]